jgi:hypothetical protein
VASWRWREVPVEGRTPTGLSLAGGVVLVVLTATATAPLTHVAGLRIAAVTAAVLAFTTIAGDGRAAGGVAVIAWAVGNGFLINRLGRLSWHAEADTWFVMGLLGAVAVGMTIAEVRREVRGRRRWWAWRELLLAAAAERVDPVSPWR